MREAFDEPSWNNPVVRVLGDDGEDLTTKLTRKWSVAGVAETMVGALGQAQQPVPTWLDLLATTSDLPARRVESAIFGMG